MQFRLTVVFTALAALVSMASATPVHAARGGFSLASRSEDGIYVFDQHGNVTSFIPDAAIKRREPEAASDFVEREARLTKRAGTACFAASVNGGYKWNAVQSLYSILADHPSVPANGAIATQYGQCGAAISTISLADSGTAATASNSIAYICNYNTQNSQNANAQDAITFDTTINNACGSSTAGRYRLDSTSSVL